jgi:peroxiredoxin
MRHLFCLIGGLWPLLIWAQNYTLRGEVKQAQGWDPVPYAVIRLPGTSLGSIANAEGVFQLSLPRELFRAGQRIEISSLGYQRLSLPITELSRGQINLLRLPEQGYTLSEVLIFASDLTPAQMVAEAFGRLDSNYLVQPYLMRTFYRHYCRENGAYSRLIEAALDLYDPVGHQEILKGPTEKMQVRLQQLRRSIDFTRLSAYQHVPIALFSTLSKDLASYRSPLSRQVNRARMTFRIADTTIYQGQPVLKIHADGTYRGWRYLCDLYLVVGSWAMVKAEEQWARSQRSASFIRDITQHYTVSYQPLGDRWVLSHILKEGRTEDRELDDRGQTWHRFVHRHHIELMVNEVKTEGFTPFEGGEPHEGLMRQVKYDPGFWENYTVLRATPLERRIEADLSDRWELEQQFLSHNANQPAPEVQEIKAEQQFERLLADYQGHPVLLVFWDSDYDPSWRELWRVRRLLQNMPEDPVGLVFISTDTDDRNWRRAIREKKLTVGEHLRLGWGLDSPVAQRYGVRNIPSLVLLDRAGELLWQGETWPKQKDMELLLEQMRE